VRRVCGERAAGFSEVQRETENTAMTGFTVDPDPSSHQVDQSFNDSQSEA
jgi:hypothetical protein